VGNPDKNARVVYGGVGTIFRGTFKLKERGVD